MFKPSNMIIIIGLAKLVEDKFSAQHKHTKKPPWKLKISQSDHNPFHSIPIKRLTPIEMEECKKKKLFYKCDEKFTQGHCCASQKLYILDVNAPMEPL